MTNQNSNTLLWIVIGIIIIIIVIYLINRQNQPLQNEGSLPAEIVAKSKKVMDPSAVNKNLNNKLSDSVISDIVAGCRPDKTDVTGVDPLSSDHGAFANFGTRKTQHVKDTDLPYDDENSDSKNFTYKKQNFTKRTPSDIADLYDVKKMLPQEVEDWFDTEPLMTTKKIKGTQLIHPKVQMGINTVSGSLRNGTHDIRGDIINPKIPVSPWGNSTIEPDTNLKGVCYKE